MVAENLCLPWVNASPFGSFSILSMNDHLQAFLFGVICRGADEDVGFDVVGLIESVEESLCRSDVWIWVAFPQRLRLT